MCNWKKWIWPGIFAVVILTALSTWLTADVVEKDLTSKALEGLKEDHSWANVSLDGRDLTLKGTAPSPEAVSDALKIADTSYDVRIVTDETELVAIASPYVLKAEKADGTITLSGNVPNDDVRAELIEAATLAAPEASLEDKMTLARGAAEGFLDLAKFSIGSLQGLINGTASISDTNVSIRGLASSFDAYDEVVSNLAGSIPGGGNLEEGTITAPTVSPYELMADYDGSLVTLSGFAPDMDGRSAIEESIKEQLPDARVTNKLRIAEGAPENFMEAAKQAMGFFSAFTQGRASFSDQELSISGVSKSSAEYEAAIAKLPNLTSGFELAENNIQPIGISPYTWSAKRDGSSLALSGYAPSTEARDRIEQNTKEYFPSAAIDNLMEIAGGETALFDAATDYGLNMLKGFASGEVALVDDKLTVKGRANSLDDYDTALAAAGSEPDGVSVTVDVMPPIVKPYRFSAVKIDNKITLSGHVENEESRAATLSMARQSNQGFEIIDELRLAEGVPAGITWESALSYGLRQLGTLEDGAISIVDENYSISGKAASIEVRNAAINSIQAGLAGGLKLSAVSIVAPEPEPEPETPAPPVAEPYRWSLSKTNAGVIISGNIADKADGDGIVSIVKSSLGITEVTDNQVIASGKPVGFDIVRRILATQVKRLEGGQGNIVGQTVSVNGRASSETIASEIKDAISKSLPEGFIGTTNILFPKPEPEPEPEPEPVVPTADPYRWNVSKQPSGITVRGNVVDDGARTSIIEMVEKTLGVSAIDKQSIALGKPKGFDMARELVTSQLRLLDAGQGNVVGNTLSVSGRAKNENIKTLVEKIVQKRLPEGFTGSTNILFPKPEPVPEPVIPSIDASQCQDLITSAIAGKKILFETDRAVIKQESETVLNSVAKAASECPAVRIEIGGHTDSRGRDAYNQELSEARANAVKTYLASAGISAARLDAKGYGETQPIASNQRPAGRTQNRRIEFNVIK